jgi:hypothetical protein
MTATRLSADMREAEKIKRLRFTQTTLGSTPGRMAAKLNQACLVRM